MSLRSFDINRARRLGAAAFFLLVLSSCSYLNSQDPNLNLPEPDISTTGMGAATGAALGAGLGVIVGASTGSAGEGLVVGSLAGAAAGGLIGNQLEQQEAKIDEQAEVLNRHEEKLLNQERELKELKRDTSFQIPEYNRTSSSSYRKAREDISRQSRDATEWIAPIEKPVKTWPKTSDKPAEKPEARAELMRPAIVDKPKIEIPAYARKGTTVVPAKTVVKEAVAEPPKKEPLRVVKAPPVTGLPPAAKPVVETKKEEATEEISEFDIPEEARDDVCVKAEQEASRARTSSSHADKLFYLRRALSLCPEAAKYHAEIGVVYAEIGRDEDAEFEFRKALDLDPENPLANEQLGMLQGIE